MAEWHLRTLDDLVALAQQAADAVSADLHHTIPDPPEITVRPWMENGVCIEVLNGYTAPSMWATTEPEAIAEVADYIQDQIAQTLGAWPVCPKHGTGLHAEVQDGKAVWRCRFGNHSIAAIGALTD